MKPYYQDKWATIYHGSCLDAVLSGMSAIVTDPPYELGFMGKTWDSKGVSFQKETWATLRKFCKPGSPILAFSGSRTFHRIAVAIEDAGWELRDTIMWVYGSGFPKSLDISKAIDKRMGVERKVLGQGKGHTGYRVNNHEGNFDDDGYEWEGKFNVTAPATPEAKPWEGYGTALKPAFEPIILGMNPLDGTFANNALKHGVAGLNIDECRVGTERPPSTGDANKFIKFKEQDGCKRSPSNNPDLDTNKGRFPANFIHDGSQSVMELFPDSGGGKFSKSGSRVGGKCEYSVGLNGRKDAPDNYGDSGSAARFFYVAKASKSERNNGLENNNHPTVKPLALMEYLCKLVKYPEYNLILDPFMGSGTTLLACITLGIPCIGIEIEEKYCEIAAKRCRQSVMELNL